MAFAEYLTREDEAPAHAPPFGYAIDCADWFTAIGAGDVDAVAALTVAGFPVDYHHPSRETTALLEATRARDSAMVELLLAHGANPAAACGEPQGSPLHYALRAQQWELFNRMAQYATSARTTDAYGATLLHRLCMNSLSASAVDAACAALEVILALRTPLDALDHEGLTALHYCALNGHHAIARRLLEAGAKIDPLIPDSWVTPLMIAALERNDALAKLLIDHGADTAHCTRRGKTPLSVYPRLATLLRAARV